jgi:hypothetical protein
MLLNDIIGIVKIDYIMMLLMILLCSAYKLGMTAKGIPQIMRPIKICIASFVVRCFLRDPAVVSLKTDIMIYYHLLYDLNILTWYLNSKLRVIENFSETMVDILFVGIVVFVVGQ